MTNLQKRHRAERNFKRIGIGAIGFSFLFLAFLMLSIFGKGLTGFTHAYIKINANFTAQEVADENYSAIIRAGLDSLFPNVTETDDKRELYGLISSTADYDLQKIVADNPKIIGKTKEVWLISSPDLDIFYKQKFDGWQDKISAKQKQFVKELKQKDLVAAKLDFGFFTRADSQDPETAGIAGSFIGSLLTIISCLAVALPLGVMTAVYLEEFSPKNRVTDMIEVNINNLAAVPSIVYGLLGLAVYLNFMELPRSAPIVGGLTLALMTVPVIIIATRASLKAVPPSIRLAAMGLGASPLQVVMHHTLPLALPGIMTGAILGIARALGETAPLLMIGMVAFIADVPKSFTDPATAMPVQIFLWSKNNQPGFVEKTAAAIIVLLVILMLINIIAVYIRKKYERRW